MTFVQIIIIRKVRIRILENPDFSELSFERIIVSLGNRRELIGFR